MYDGEEYDSTGTVKLTTNNRVVLEGLNMSDDLSLIEEFCEKALEDCYAWNNMFCREHACKVIRKWFGIDMSHLN